MSDFLASPDELWLRLFLLSGLILHKVVWEILKRQAPNPPVASRSPVSLTKRLVKLFKSGFLVFLIIQTMFLNIFPISDQLATIRVVGLFIYSIGLAIAIIGRFQLGDNWANIEDYQVLQGQTLVQRGVYRYIRHPIYAGDVLLLMGLELALHSWLFLLAFGVALIVFRQARAEETILSNQFPGYAEYQKQTKMFVPFVL